MATILVIDDHELVRKRVNRMLQGGGHTVLEASDGGAGVDLAQEQTPDLVLCDINMPVLDGYGVLARLREHPRTATTPFIFLSGVCGPKEVRRGMGEGADDYLPKPFEKEELLQAVNVRLRRQRCLARSAEENSRVLRTALMTTIPHEVRTPVTAMLGSATVLAERIDSLNNDQVRRLAKTLQKAASRMFRTIDNHLFYRDIVLDRDTQERHSESESASRQLCTPEQLASDLTQLCSHLAIESNRSADLSVEIRATVVPVPYDDIKKIVEELVDNALKFSAAGSIIAVDVDNDAHGTLRLTVSDYGRGMTQEQIDGIDAFRQFERDRFEQQGSGLGLAIVFALATNHAGTVSVHSAPLGGTSVFVRLGATRVSGIESMQCHPLAC